MDALTPTPVGTVASLIGAPLRADVTFPLREELAGYEIELAPGQKGERSKAWATPLWRMTSAEPQFVWLDERRAFDGMSIQRRRPVARMATVQPIDAYSWELRQDGDSIERGSEVTKGIAADGLSFEFRPRKRLRRSGRAGKARRKGVFYPPFDSHLPNMPRTEDSRIRYTAMTHAGHDEQDAYSVDFNWGAGNADRGHWVRSAAVGRVSKVDPANGQVHIEHPQFDGTSTHETVYAHLDPVLVKQGQRVKAQQRIGKIGSTYYGTDVISPHLHHQHLRDGEPVKMNLFIEGKETPIGASLKRPTRTVLWDQMVPGWVRPRGPAPARLVVRARDAAGGTWSGQSDLEFVLATRDDPALEGEGTPFGAIVADSAIAFEYNGPEVGPGQYTFRYRAKGDAGTQTPWAYDRSVTVELTLA